MCSIIMSDTVRFIKENCYITLYMYAMAENYNDNVNSTTTCDKI